MLTLSSTQADSSGQFLALNSSDERVLLHQMRTGIVQFASVVSTQRSLEDLESSVAKAHEAPLTE